ncbi:Setd1a protein [Capsaspora owczarzaki ATCC 30864]|uniref:Setd1a protein n=1 Tax=Capsaspora owczarzaki (strain ATCC 30864) TaxID=595528 RepID=UPI000352606E|nr:Setd1a protein [Capsaspora owczarzaki ATCC 30864]|eukprot:XP_004363308.2 Setd1a protein [Capsaspora owczarzaki ATCC 30864]
MSGSAQDDAVARGSDALKDGAANEPSTKDFKVLVDPGLSHDRHAQLERRFDGIDPKTNTPVTVVDPRRGRPPRYTATLDLTIPRFKFDEHSVGDAPNRILFLSELNDNVESSFLLDELRKLGSVETAKVHHHPQTGRHLGIASVVFPSVRECTRLLPLIDGRTFMGKPVKAELDGSETKRRTEYARLTGTAAAPLTQAPAPTPATPTPPPTSRPPPLLSTQPQQPPPPPPPPTQLPELPPPPPPPTEPARLASRWGQTPADTAPLLAEPPKPAAPPSRWGQGPLQKKPSDGGAPGTGLLEWKPSTSGWDDSDVSTATPMATSHASSAGDAHVGNNRYASAQNPIAMAPDSIERPNIIVNVNPQLLSRKWLEDRFRSFYVVSIYQSPGDRIWIVEFFNPNDRDRALNRFDRTTVDGIYLSLSRGPMAPAPVPVPVPAAPLLGLPGTIPVGSMPGGSIPTHAPTGLLPTPGAAKPPLVAAQLIMPPLPPLLPPHLLPPQPAPVIPKLRPLLPEAAAPPPATSSSSSSASSSSKPSSSAVPRQSTTIPPLLPASAAKPTSKPSQPSPRNVPKESLEERVIKILQQDLIAAVARDLRAQHVEKPAFNKLLEWRAKQAATLKDPKRSGDASHSHTAAATDSNNSLTAQSNGEAHSTTAVPPARTVPLFQTNILGLGASGAAGRSAVWALPSFRKPGASERRQEHQPSSSSGSGLSSRLEHGRRGFDAGSQRKDSTRTKPSAKERGSKPARQSSSSGRSERHARVSDSEDDDESDESSQSSSESSLDSDSEDSRSDGKSAKQTPSKHLPHSSKPSKAEAAAEEQSVHANALANQGTQKRLKDEKSSASSARGAKRKAHELDDNDSEAAGLPAAGKPDSRPKSSSRKRAHEDDLDAEAAAASLEPPPVLHDLLLDDISKLSALPTSEGGLARLKLADEQMFASFNGMRMVVSDNPWHQPHLDVSHLDEEDSWYAAAAARYLEARGMDGGAQGFNAAEEVEATWPLNLSNLEQYLSNAAKLPVASDALTHQDRTLKRARLHATGSARSEGFYKPSHEDKKLVMHGAPAYLTGIPGLKFDSTLRNTMYAVTGASDASPQTPGTSSATVSTALASGSPSVLGMANASVNRANRLQLRQFAAVIEQATNSDTFSLDMLKSRKKLLKFQRSGIHAFGLFSQENISANDLVIEYVGEVIRQSISDIREHHYERRGIGSSYFFRIDEDHVVDATYKGNLARFMNHCCEPNCYAKIIMVDGHQRIVIYSKRDIKKGEEITYDYKFPYEENKIPCLCGAVNCKKFLN